MNQQSHSGLRLLRILAPVGFALIVGACSPAILASLAMDFVDPGEGSSMMHNPMDRQPGKSLQDQLSRLDDTPSSRCKSTLAEERQKAASASGEMPPPHEPGMATSLEAGDRTASPEATAEGSSSQSGTEIGGCHLEPVCLPGYDEPVDMLICRQAGS